MIENIKNRFIVCKKNPNLFKIKVEKNNLFDTVDFLISNGFITLVHLSCADWIEDDVFSLNYNFTTEIRDVNLMLEIDIKRDNESVPTLLKQFPQVEVMERDLHEMYGIDFVGNKTLFDFALENWKDIPPMRREFDTLAFVNENFDFRGGRDDNKDTKQEMKRRRAEAKALKEANDGE
jgi:NADH-quinone oxidoreductase subunit C